ncbi:hypothetical protein CWI36_0003p0110 [Hamiltosporidium magnivora]|uniref:Uncharacterized protein n=1 Tax=Hamiltosporidium magnivora TaxID=148818 RepID=A0A4Q9LMZ6_9MICR|nr:hypothetical protein CWI36_0003p0110 [Hamiltosporidium magnivora]
MEDNNSKKLSESSRIQYLEQRKVGLKIFLLTDVLPNINCEEDLEVILKYQDNIQTDGEDTIQNEHFDVSTSFQIDYYDNSSTKLFKPSYDLNDIEREIKILMPSDYLASEHENGLNVSYDLFFGNPDLKKTKI